MVGILFAAGITTVTVLPIIYVMWWSSRTSLATLLPFFIQLPMSLLLNVTVKQWLNNSILGLGLPLISSLLLLLLVAPFTEEAVKLLGLPLLRYSPIPHRNAAGAQVKIGWRQIRAGGVMSGLGFGVGEIWAIAFLVCLLDPSLCVYPWFFYQGFIIERFLVVFIHGLMALVSYWGFWRWLPVTYLAAVGLHTAVNAPVIPYQLGFIDYIPVLLYLVLLCVVAFFMILINFTKPEKRSRRIQQKIGAEDC